MDMVWGRVMTGVEWVGLRMKKLALVVPLLLLVYIPVLLTHVQAQEEGNDI
jgi:hypothetical protein